jgi:2-haloalkanoic acid dehalogenase type II
MSQGERSSGGRYDAVVFDLLTALLDSWSLWTRVAGDAETGRRWRRRYLDVTYAAGHYQPYDALVARSAVEAQLPARLAGELIARWDEVEPWPEVASVLAPLQRRIPLAVVTNCSESLARRAVARTGIEFPVVVSAERAGWYKPSPQPYRQALAELGVEPGRALFVAGSMFDIGGASAVGMPVAWHDRLGLQKEYRGPAPLVRWSDLRPLPVQLGLAAAGL